MVVRLIFKRYPLLVGMASYGGIWTASSISQQKILSQHKVDFKAVARNAAVGMFVMAPLLHGWYRVVHRVIGSQMIWQVSIKKVVVEQLVFGPFIITSFFASTAALSGATNEEIKEEIIEKVPKTYLIACCFWPAINFINHLLVPFHYKVLFQGSVSFIWSNFLCLVKERPINHYGKTEISAKE